MQAIQICADEITAETARAMNLHPPIHSAHEAYSVILEEVDEFWKLVKINPNKLSGVQRATRQENMREELTQIAAMALRSIVDLGL